MDFHPACLLLPEMTGDDFDELTASIKAKGLADEIITLDDKILDGRNRYKACLAAGVEPRFRPFSRVIDFDGDPVDFVIAKNLARRHLTTSQRTAIASDLATMKQSGAMAFQPRDEIGQVKAVEANLPRPKTIAEAAKTMGVSERGVKMENVVKAASPELHARVKAGKLTVNAAKKQVEAKAAEAPRPAADRAEDHRVDGGVLSWDWSSPREVGAGLANLNKSERNKALAEIIVAAMKLVAPTPSTQRQVVDAIVSLMAATERKALADLAKLSPVKAKARDWTPEDDAKLKEMGQTLSAAFNRKL